MSCGAFSLVGLNGAEAGVFPLRCRRWSCPTCGRRKVRAAMARIGAGMKIGPTRFLTLTSPGGESAEESYARFPERWKRMHQRLIRRFGKFEYIAVVEPQPKRGAAHIHIVYRGAFIPQQWLSKAAAESGFGKIADIRRGHRKLAGYLAKYLTKDLTSQGGGDRGAAGRSGIPRYFRRVRWSRGWCEWTRRRASRTWTAWFIADVGQVHAASDARGRGYTVVELEVSEGSLPVSRDRIVRWLRSLRGYRPFALPVMHRPAQERA